MKKKSCFLFIAAIALVTISSCTKDRTTTGVLVDCSGISATTNTYALNIGPNIVDVYCNYAPCHGGGSAGGGVDMSSYSSVVYAMKNQNVIAGMKGQLELMPKGGPALPDSLIRQMECWQQNGFPQ